MIDTEGIDIFLLVLEHSSSFINECNGTLLLTPLQFTIYKEEDENFYKYSLFPLLFNNSNVMVSPASSRNETALYSACKFREFHAILLFERPDIDPSSYTNLSITAFYVVFQNHDESAILGFDYIEMVDYETNENYHREITSRNPFPYNN